MFLPLLFNFVLEIPASARRQEKNRRQPDWEGRSVPLPKWYDFLCGKAKEIIKTNKRQQQQKLLELICECDKKNNYFVSKPRYFTVWWPCSHPECERLD